jgi:hypothetical protein
VEMKTWVDLAAPLLGITHQPTNVRERTGEVSHDTAPTDA